MAVYNKKIDRNTNWGGDASTGYLPVAGERVQEFIKDELNNKVGAFYKAPGSNFIFCFATLEDKEEYITSGDEALIVDRIEVDSNYTVYINQEGLVLSKSVIEGTTGNTVTFQFKITDKSGMVSDSKAIIEYSFLSAGNIKRYTSQVQVKSEGWTTVISDVIDDYLKLGENTITISIQGLSTKTTSQFIMTYNVFNLSYNTNFAYNIAQGGNTIEIPYNVSCNEIPINLEYYLDGRSVSSVESMVVNEYSKDGIANINIAGLDSGKHTLQARAYIVASDGSRFYSDTQYYGFCVRGEGNPTFLMKKVFKNTQPIINYGETLTIDINQFEEFSMDWSLFDYRERKLTVNFEYDGEIILKPVFDSNGTIYEFSFKPLVHGNGKVLRIFAIDDNDELVFEDRILFNVTESATGIKEATEGLLLKLSAVGRRNTDSDYDNWSCVGNDGVEYSATFHNFNWNKQQGWNEDYEALVISDDAYVDFNIQPMIKNWQTYGGTFEIDLETFDIDNDDAVICECKTEIQEMSTSYFRITSTNAEFATADGIKINTRYKDNEKLKIAFIGNKIGTGEDDNLIYIVVNGVLERAQIYSNNDKIYSNAYLRIGTGNGGCKVRLHSIRVYDRALTVDEAFSNYVIDSPNSQIIYEKNNVIKKGTTNEIGFDEVANKLPVMIFTGNMKELVEAGQDKNWRIFDVEYVNRQEPERSFMAFNCQMKLQGTSSLGYPRKNFKLKTKNKYFSKENNYYLDDYEVNFTDTEEGNRRLLNKRTGKLMDFGELTTDCLTYDYQGNPLNKGKYRFRADSHKATKWTLKADFMESSCSHNVGAGRSWNAIFENTIFEPGNFAGYTNNTYKDSALVYSGEFETYEKDGVEYRIPRNINEIKNQKNFVCRTDAQKICHAMNADDIRTAVDGFPMVCFYRTSHESNDLVFMGQYNFINDKGSYEVFGFEDIEDPEDDTRMIYDATKVECWEGLKNANPISLFKTVENWDNNELGWKSTYEARYPDPEDFPSDASALFELSKWLVSTRHDSGTTYSGTLNIDAAFARRINSYQYGYSDDNADEYSYAEGTNLPDNAENRQKKFETEKWEHFDVWKLAGYYIYLMRYGAVDQFVKNTMLFTDGNGLYDPRTDKKYRKWFFINYDNDCLFGLRNNGELAFHWNLDRQTLDGASDIIIDSGETETDVNTYAMMGHDSTLWNNLEADDEFMRMVRDLDNSMSNYGLNYENMVTEFDTKQTEMWCERIYNANERYKYIQAAKGIGDMSGNPVNNLWMLQGTRRSHRHWWIANHFNLYDAKWLSGKYRQTYLEIKTDCISGDTIYAKAGTDYYFAWGLQKKIYESNIEKRENEPINYVFSTNQVQGDPVYIYAVNKLSEMDFSEVAYKVATGSFKFVIGDREVPNLLKKLVIGNPNVINYATGIDVSTWALLNNLEYLDITNYKGIINLPLESLGNLRTLKAYGSGLASFAPANGSRYELVELPETITTINLNNITFNSFSNDFNYTPTLNLREVFIDGNRGITNIYYEKLIKPWIIKINNSTTPIAYYDQSSLKVYHVNWNFSSLDDIKIFANFKKYSKEGNFSLRGVIDLTACGALNMEDIEKIKEIFGENCFNEQMSSIYIKTPETIFIHTQKNEMAAGRTNVFTREIYPDESVLGNFDYNIFYAIVEETEDSTQYIDYANGQKYYRILTEDEIKELRNKNGQQLIHGINKLDADGKEIYELTVDEVNTGRDTNIKVMAALTTGDFTKISVCDFTILDPTYASTATIIGDSSLYKNNEYVFRMELKTSNGFTPIGSERVEWELLGDDGEVKYINTTAIEDETLTFVITTTNNEPEISVPLTLNATVYNGNGTSLSVTKRLLALNSNVIMTSETNPVVMEICYNNGWALSSNALLKDEAEAIEEIGTVFAYISDEFSFNELKYFTGIREIPYMAFYESKITEITIPKNVETIGALAFKRCNLLKQVNSMSSNGIFQEYVLDNITVIPEGLFNGCTSLNKLILSDTIKEIDNYAFGNTNFTRALLSCPLMATNILVLPRHVEKISGNAFENEDWSPEKTVNKLTAIEIPLTLRLALGGYSLLYGKNYTEYLVEEAEEDETQNYSSIDGVLYDSRKTVLVKYPAKKARTFETEIYSLDALYNNYGYSIQTIYSNAFLFVENIDKIEMSRFVSSIGESCFAYCKANIIDLEMADNLTYIPKNTFNNCTMLSNLTLPSTIKKIGVSAFRNCTSLEELELPNGLMELESSGGDSKTFENCRIQEIVFPDTVESMGFDVIYNCNNLTKVVFPRKFVLVVTTVTKRYYIENCAMLNTIVCPVSSYYDNISYNVYDENNNLIGTYSTELEATSNMPVGGHVEFHGDNVVVNRNYGFIVNKAPSLVKFEFAEGDNGNECYIYNDCIYSKDDELQKVPYSKDSVTIKDNCISLEEGAFESCVNLTEINIPDSVVTIRDHVFENCINIRELTIPVGVTDLPYNSFYNASSLERLYIKGNVTNIGFNAFAGCIRLKKLYLCSEVAPSMKKGNLSSYHPFGERANNYAGSLTNYTNENRIYIIKGATGYDFDGDANNNSWVHPVTDIDKCGYTYEDMAITGEIILTVYNEGTLLNNDFVYVKSQYSEIGSGVASKIVEGKYSLIVSKLYHGETFEIYLDRDYNEKIGELVCNFFERDYQVNEPIMSLGRGMLLKLGSVNNEEESIVLNKKDYDNILSRLDYLTDAIGFLKK